MKYLTKNAEYFLMFLFFGLIHTSSNAQIFLNKHHLSDDVESSLNSNPEQSLKIAQYILSKTNTPIKEKAKVNFLISKAYIVKGDYSSALNFLYEEKNYKNYLTEIENIEVEIDKISLLRELTLDNQSKKNLENLKQFGKKISNEQKQYLETAVAIEESMFLLKEGKPAEGIALLEKINFPKTENGKSFNKLHQDYMATLGYLYLVKNDLNSAQKYFQEALQMIDNQSGDDFFSKIKVLYGLSKVFSLKKEYDKAITLNEEAFGYAKRLNNIFLQVQILEQQGADCLALNRMDDYRLVNTKFFELQDQTEAQEQEAINTAYNVISDEYDGEFSVNKSNLTKIVYAVFGLLLLVVFFGIILWQKKIQRKKGLEQIISYIEITRNTLLSGFSVADKKATSTEPRKHLILKETEEQILLKLKKFENSKRFINKDISLAVLAGQLDSNTKYLSEIINTHYNVNFNTYINKLRINYIIEKLKTDPNYINYKISYLAENCGFSSHSSFATVFKSITGISPVKFIELLNHEKEDNLLKNNE